MGGEAGFVVGAIVALTIIVFLYRAYTMANESAENRKKSERYFASQEEKERERHQNRHESAAEAERARKEYDAFLKDARENKR